MLKTNDHEDRSSELYFQLSSADRRRIIDELLTQNLKLNEIAKKLDITATEAFRQLQRLTDANLLEKTTDGKYRSTLYAKLILESASAMQFLSQHREYFLGHDASRIPPKFRARFGELSKTVLLTESVPNLNTVSEIFKNAKWVDVMSDQGLEHHGKILRERSLEGVKVRFLLQESITETMEETQLVVEKGMERRFIPRICSVMVLTDKTAGMSLPNLEGKMDYQVLAGTDPESMRWMRDLFEDQWNEARP